MTEKEIKDMELLNDKVYYEEVYGMEELSDLEAFTDLEETETLDEYYRFTAPAQKIAAEPVKRGKLSPRFIACLAAVVVGAAGLGAGIGVGNGLVSHYYAAQTPESVQETSYFSSDSDTVLLASSISNSDAISVIKGTSNSVVSINVVQLTTYNYGFYGRPMEYEQKSAGSGVIFYEDTNKIYIMTNNHVINNATGVTISIDDENVVEANFVGSNSDFDLAVISVDKAKLTEAGITNYSLAKFGDSDRLEVGEMVVAIGNAYGEGKSATQGIVSALNKQVTTSDGTLLEMIQTDAAINPGNSGGALVNSSSQVIGVNTAKVYDTAVEGMGYSIPSNTAKRIVEEIMQNGSSSQGYLGIRGAYINEDYMKAYNFPSTGVYVDSIVNNSTAATSGIKSGDLIVKFNGVDITSMEVLTEAILATKAGQEVDVVLYSNSTQTTTLTITMQGVPNSTNF